LVRIEFYNKEKEKGFVLLKDKISKKSKSRPTPTKITIGIRGDSKVLKKRQPGLR